MKSFLIALFMSSISFLTASSANDDAIPNFKIDAGQLTPSQNHKILGASKADLLEKIRKQYPTERTTFFDQTEYDVTFYQIDIAINIDNEYIDSSTVRIVAKSTIDGLNTLELDFIDSLPEPLYYPDWKCLIVDSVFTESELLNFEHHDNKLIVELDNIYNTNEEFSFSVRYHGNPPTIYKYNFTTGKMNGEGLAFGKQRSLLGGTSEIPVAYTNCEPYDSRRWWPCKDRPDDKADSVNINVSTVEPYYCVSNGILWVIDRGHGTPEPLTFKYRARYPIATYLVSFAVSEYTVWSDWYHYGETDSMEIINHVYPEVYDDSYEPYRVTPYAIEVLSNLCCQYPFIEEKYGHAHWEVFGAMEHQTCTSTMPDSWGWSEPIIVHELAHQWFGDMITCKTWHDIWLNEGFASYAEALYYEEKSGLQAYLDYMTGMEYYSNRSVYVYDTTHADDVFDIVVYDKGAWVLHMLRYYIGDESFFNLLHEYSESGYVFGSLTTEEFIDFCEASAGRELNEFFNDWVYNIMFPVYACAKYIEQDLADGQYWIYYNIIQAQTYGPDVFEMPLDLRLYSNGNIILDTTVANDKGNKLYIFKTAEYPDSVAVDPDNWILNKSFNMPWKYRLIPHPMSTAMQYYYYTDTIICIGGSGHNEFQIVSGNIPNGLALDDETGEISGVAEEAGEFVFSIRADDKLSSYNDVLEYSLTVSEADDRPGDANGDKLVDILDIVFLINYKYKDGPAPAVPTLADPNNDCDINILDVIYLINYRYKDGAAPLLGCASR